MGTTAQKLEYLGTTKSQLKDMINYGLPTDEQITSSTTFRNYVKSIFKAFIESLNDSSTLYSNLPKKSASGNQITLNDTANAPMRITLGSVPFTQDGTPTPETPQEIHSIKGSNTLKVEGKNLIPKATKMNDTATDIITTNGITYTNLGGGHINIKGTAIATSNIFMYRPTNENEPIIIPIGTYTFSSPSIPNGVKIIISGGGNNGFPYTELSSSLLSNTGNVTDGTKPLNYITIRVDSGTTVDTDLYYQLEVGSTATEWQPYVSQTADVDIESKNKLDTSLLPISRDGITITKNSNGDIVINGTPNWSSGYHTFNIGKTSTSEIATYTLSMKNKRTGLGLSIGSGNLNITMSETTTSKTYTFTNSFTITPSININYDAGTFNDVIINPQLEKGSSVSEYTPYYNYGEYGSINDYKDKFIRTSGKNLFDKNNYEQGYCYISQAKSSNANWGIYYLPCIANETYTITGLKAYSGTDIMQLNKSKTIVSRLLYRNSQTSATITATQNGYIGISFVWNSSASLGSELDTLMLNKGTTALDYEPYGNGDWYLKKNILEKIFDGTEDWIKSTSYPGNYYLRDAIPNSIQSNTNVVCNKTKNILVSTGELTNYDNCLLIESASEIKTLNFKNSNVSTIEEFKADLGTTNLIVKYVAQTPTYTQITGTLAEQLEYVYQMLKSYKGQTNISQVNDDLPFELNVSALEDLE